MPGQRFRLNAATIALIFEHGNEIAVRVPTGAEIWVIDTIPNPVVDQCHRVNATWGGRAVKMFAADIRDHGIAAPSPLIDEE
jgi:hypothetical protein